MAQKVLIEMTDDLDGGKNAQTVPFALDGVAYEIDLSTSNASGLRKELDRYVKAARRTGGRKIRVAGEKTPTQRKEKARQVRAWAGDAGYEVSVRGRIPVDIEQAYEEAQNQPPVPVAAKATAPARKRAPRKKAAAKKTPSASTGK
jgi:hypothetical protein